MDLRLPARKKDPATQVQRLQSLRSPLVPDLAGDVGVLRGRSDHRSHPGGCRRDLETVVNPPHRLDGHDVLESLDTVAVLEMVEEGVVLQNVCGLLDLGGEHPGQAGDHSRFEVGPGEPGRQGVDANEQPDLGVALPHAGDRRGHRRTGGFLLSCRHGVLKIEDDAVGSGCDGLADPLRTMARHEQDRSVGLHV
jgi:hypothetical protein